MLLCVLLSRELAPLLSVALPCLPVWESVCAPSSLSTPFVSDATINTVLAFPHLPYVSSHLPACPIQPPLAGTGTPPSAPPPSPDPQTPVTKNPPPTLSPLWTNLASKVLKQCGVTLLGTKVVVDCQVSGDFCHGRSSGARTNTSTVGEGQRSVSAEVFISSLEACARPLDGGRDGIKLVVRVGQVRGCDDGGGGGGGDGCGCCCCCCYSRT